jgi:predicted acyltransferase
VSKTTSQSGAPASARLASLDALRGFDMFWLLGGQQIVAAIGAGAAAGTFAHAVNQQFTHVEWEGFRFYDFIFPLFQFLIGVAIPLAVAKRLARGDSRGTILRHAFVRLWWMIFIGFFIHGNLQSWKISEMRLSYSVLEMLGLGYVIAVVCVLYLSRRGQVIATAAFLVGYWALQMFVPVPGHEWGVFKEGGLFGDWLYDHTIGLLGKPWQSHWGRGFPFLPMWTHAATTMLGVFGAYVLMGKTRASLIAPPRHEPRFREGETPVESHSGRTGQGSTGVSPSHASAPSERSSGAGRLISDTTTLLWLIGLGLGCLLVGWIWSFHLPIVKNRWTSTFALWCGGLSYLLLALFWWVLDVKGWRRGLGLWTAIGSNSILAYIMAALLMGGFGEVAWVFLGGLKPHLGDYWHNLVIVLAQFSLAWAVLIHLRRRKIFLRL